MNTEEDEFQRIEAEAKRRAAQDDDDDTQVYTSNVALAEAYRCGYEAGVVAEREACAAMFDDRNVWDEEVGERIRARSNHD